MIVSVTSMEKMNVFMSMMECDRDEEELCLLNRYQE